MREISEGPQMKRMRGEESCGKATQAGGLRITAPAELHAALGLQVPSAFPEALEPIHVTAETFCERLRPAFTAGLLSYRAQIGAIRRHKKVAFFEVNILPGPQSTEAKDADNASPPAVLGGSAANVSALDASAAAVHSEPATLTQLVVDAEAVGSECFATTLPLCLGDVLAVEARWIWDPRRACPLNLAAARLQVVSRWDTESVVALRKGGFHKVRGEHSLATATRPSSRVHSLANEVDPAAFEDSDRNDGAVQVQHGTMGGAGFASSQIGAMGSKSSKTRGVIKSKRVSEEGTGGGGDASGEHGWRGSGALCAASSEEAEGHGSREGTKDRARKMCEWVLAKTQGSPALRAHVLDVAGGAGYLAMQLCKHGIPVTIVDPRPQRAFNRSERKWAAKRGTPLPEHKVPSTPRLDQVPPPCSIPVVPC